MVKRRHKQRPARPAGKPAALAPNAPNAPSAPDAPSAPNKAEPARSRKAKATAEHLAARPPRPPRPQAPGASPRAARRAAAAARSSSGTSSQTSPRFALEMSTAKLALARFALFAVLVIDAVLQVSHAGRYGAGGFNVPHLPGLPGPGREAYLFCQCAIACLAAIVAVGAGGRLVPAALSLLYGWCYFGSQLDSYQHHYLAWLIVTLWCFVPAPPILGEAPTRGAPPPAFVRSSALRLILLQLGILYLWAAVSKLDPKWLDGTAMSLQIGGLLREVVDATVGIKIASRLVVVAELGLAVTVWRAPAWRWALPLGLGLHASIAVSGLEIGVFAYLMIALYLLLVPEAWLAPLFARARDATRLPGRWLVPIRGAFARGHRGVCAALLVAAAALLALLRPPFSGALVGALFIVFLAIPAVLTLRWQLEPVHRFATRMALAVALALGLLVVVDRAAGVSIDYHRHLSGAEIDENVESEPAR